MPCFGGAFFYDLGSIIPWNQLSFVLIVGPALALLDLETIPNGAGFISAATGALLVLCGIGTTTTLFSVCGCALSRILLAVVAEVVPVIFASDCASAVGTAVACELRISRALCGVSVTSGSGVSASSPKYALES